MGNAAVFLDKDGTLLRDVPYNVNPSAMELAEGAAEGVRLLTDAGYPLIVVTNQSGVARGYFGEEALGPVEDRLRELLADAGGRLAGFYYCPHHPEGATGLYAAACRCRKPEPGLILRAGEEHRVDLNRSWLVGDILNDVEAGRRAGTRTILLDNGNETEWELTPQRQPDYRAADLAEAAQIVLSVDGHGG